MHKAKHKPFAMPPLWLVHGATLGGRALKAPFLFA